MINLESKELLQQFASDNYAGICPEAWSASEGANQGHATSYGDDPWTARASDAFRELFECECDVYFVFNGTAANSLALASLCQSYHGVICCDQAHVETDECGAPEFFSNGSKLLVAPSADGKLTPDAIHELATKRQDIHYPKPRAVTLTQSTETGRVYTLAELGAISDECKTHGLSLHMDGARCGARCSCGCPPGQHGRRALCQCLCEPWVPACGIDMEERRGCSVLWWHKERHGSGRGGAVLRSQAGHGFRLPLQAGRSTRIKEALPFTSP